MAQSTPSTTSDIVSKSQPKTDKLPGIHYVVYPVCWSLVWIYYRLGGRKVYGRENVPRKGAVIFASNHVSLLDPPALNLALPRVPRTMAKAELFKGFWGWVVTGLGAFPVRRGAPDRTAIRSALKVLKAGIPLSVFPEGTRSRDGNLGPAGRGFAYIVHSAKVPVIPVYLHGNENTLSPPHPGFRLVRNDVWFGPALDFEKECQEKATKEVLDSISERVMAAIAELRDQARSDQVK